METERHEIVRYRTLITVWVALLALTALTVFVSAMHAGPTSLLVPLLIASAKAGLVLWFFMHLKYERKLLRTMLLFPIVTLGVIMGLTFMDIWFR